MAGLSMGGMQTFQVTFDHLELFSYIGGFSGAAGPMVLGNEKLDPKTAFHGALADPAAFAKRVHLLWVGVGTESPGTSHEWQTWRRDLNEFAPKLFLPVEQ